MLHKSKKFFIALILMVSWLLSKLAVCAADYDGEAFYKNNETGYRAVIDDRAGLFSENDPAMADAMATMQAITAYADVALLTTDHNSGTERDYAK